MPSEEAWNASVAKSSPDARAKSLIDYEVKKRVFWALTAQDWFSIPYRRTTGACPAEVLPWPTLTPSSFSAVQPTQVTTPLPSNARDE
jgi:hypothetical protein